MVLDKLKIFNFYLSPFGFKHIILMYAFIFYYDYSNGLLKQISVLIKKESNFFYKVFFSLSSILKKYKFFYFFKRKFILIFSNRFFSELLLNGNIRDICIFSYFGFFINLNFFKNLSYINQHFLENYMYFWAYLVSNYYQNIFIRDKINKFLLLVDFVCILFVLSVSFIVYNFK